MVDIRLSLEGPSEEVQKFVDSFLGHPAYYWIEKELFKNKLYKINRGIPPTESYEDYNRRIEKLQSEMAPFCCLNALFPVPEHIRMKGFRRVQGIPLSIEEKIEWDGATWQLYNWGTVSEIRALDQKRNESTLATYEFMTGGIPRKWVNQVSKKFPNTHFILTSDNGDIVEEFQIKNGKLLCGTEVHDPSRLNYFMLWAHICKCGVDEKFHDKTFQDIIEEVGFSLGLERIIKIYNKLKETTEDDYDINNLFYSKPMIADYLQYIRKTFAEAIVSVYTKQEETIASVKDDVASIKKEMK